MHAEPDFIPEEEEPAVTPGDDSNDDPTPPLPADPGPAAPERNPAVDMAANDPRPPPANEEPEIGHDGQAIPSDDLDPEGEGMIRDVEKPPEPAPDKPERE